MIRKNKEDYRLLGQEYSAAVRVPDVEKFFIHDPALVRTRKGTLIVAAPQWERDTWPPGPDSCLRIARSIDGGKTWQETPGLPCQEGTPFLLDGRLLMFVQEKTHKDFQIVSSEDDGLTWSRPKTVLAGPLWNISTSRVIREDAMYWAMDYDIGMAADMKGKVMARLQRNASPFDESSWSLSNVVEEPEMPGLLDRKLFPGKKSSFTWLEPNTVEVGGQIRVFTRCCVDAQATANVAAVLDYDVSKNRLQLAQLAPWPGGQCKFFILDDRKSGFYWMLSNLATNSQNLIPWEPREPDNFAGSPGNERRWLFLHYSLDCLNWFPAGCVAFWPDSIRQSFMYPSAVIDGEDMVVLCRTSRDGKNQHDADICTVHRIEGFRGLALPLRRGHPF